MPRWWEGLRRVGLCVALAGSLALSSSARAEELIIKHPDDHPHYAVDLEPHGLLGFGPFDKAALGVGARATIIVLQNGFISSLNNSIGVGAGGDFFFVGGKNSGVSVFVPVVMQWNFWLSTHWAVFGEPGVGFAFNTDHVVQPVVAGGGRYHFTDKIALTLRVGYPAVSVGVSFYF